MPCSNHEDLVKFAIVFYVDEDDDCDDSITRKEANVKLESRLESRGAYQGEIDVNAALIHSHTKKHITTCIVNGKWNRSNFFRSMIFDVTIYICLP